MPDEPVVPADPPIQADPRLALLADVRAALGRGRGIESLMSTLFGLDVCKLALTGISGTELVRRAESLGMETSRASVAKLKALVAEFPPELKSRIEKADPISRSMEPSALQAVRSSMDSLSARMADIEREMADARKRGEAVSEKRDDQLLKYHDKYNDMRKQLERLRLESEVEQAARRAAVDVGVIAMGLMDDAKRAEFLEKIRTYQRDHL